ncbi:hypothetical protein KIPB_008287 [Kipferlia bialata]|uniref:UBX domain-containing protein n=1 Tax=Kipferlia bialata TaxID=797122 RepID=A0A9K3CZS8_9EUKA|nr:hypothetical protein KIPB_008287 [Kipferlia bialata]|eukprot:g8287.t1
MEAMRGERAASEKSDMYARERQRIEDAKGLQQSREDYEKIKREKERAKMRREQAMERERRRKVEEQIKAEKEIRRQHHGRLTGIGSNQASPSAQASKGTYKPATVSAPPGTTCRLRFRLMTSNKQVSTPPFPLTHTFRQAEEWLRAQDMAIPHGSHFYRLTPVRQVIPMHDWDRTLVDLGLAPSAVIIIDNV